ncbi:hypothetical protein HDV04_002480 [Boothiomyces sp. JEL0838]|nr:hypothetical protein HDV04_002480 [Boothiomyces sp. JEL0838]
MQKWVNELKYTSSYWSNRSRILETILQEKDVTADFEGRMQNLFIEQTHMRQLIENHILTHHKIQLIRAEELSGSNHDGFKRRLERMAMEINSPVVRERNMLEQQSFIANKEEILSDAISNICIPYNIFPSKVWDGQHVKICLYDDMDLFDALKNIKCSSPLHLAVLKEKYRDLHPIVPQIGLQDQECLLDLNFVQKHTEEGEQLLVNQSAHQIQKYCKKGIPSSMRPELWSIVLRSEIAQYYPSHVKRIMHTLNKKVAMYDLMIDRIIQVDAKHAQHDDGYFVFEEMIRDVLLYWSRDDWIKDNIRLDYLEQRDCSPLEIAFKWILYAFVGILDCDQVLLLWDRIIGYDSLDILSLTAVAIFDFRRDFLLNCKSRSEVMVMKY